MIKKLVFATLFPLSILAQNTLKGNFATENGYTYGILYRIAPDNIFYIDDANVGADGSLEIPLKKQLTPGVYRLVYNLPQDQHFFDFIYDGKSDVAFNFSDEKKVTYLNSPENTLWNTYRNKSLQFESTLLAMIANKNANSKELSNQLNIFQKWHDSIQESAPRGIVTTLIEATKPYFVSEVSNKNTYVIAAKEAYLKQLDLNTPLLQNSNIPLEQVVKYIFNYSDATNKIESRKKNIDEVAKTLLNTEILYQKHLLFSVYNFMVVNQQIELANYLASTYLINIASKLNDTKMVTQLNTFKNISIGAKAPNFNWLEYEGDTEILKSLYALDGAKQYVLVFWSSMCSHCLKEVPILHENISTMDESNIKVIAVGLEDFEAEWAPKAAQFNSFINVCGLGKWDNEIGNAYDITGTPTYFVLDTDKKITHKPETLQELLGIINANE